jgi:hypothetical protein
MKCIAMHRIPLDLRRYAPSMPPHQVRWIASTRRPCPACALRPWHPSPARKSLHRVPLLLDRGFALRRAPPRPGQRARTSRVVAIGKMLASLG